MLIAARVQGDDLAYIVVLEVQRKRNSLGQETRYSIGFVED